ncbi:MAG: aminotransferase class V-fold PLP-dependent enzyme [Bdellovibrionales bacterium]|nr:aminotransferase class V-fold PLP-dependent enzyme [Bdellovibrionales bacterium]
MITQREIYLDCNATHPLLPSVRQGLSQAILQECPSLANPSSIHRRGQAAKKGISDLRAALCQALGRGDGDEFILLSGATEAINLAMRGFVEERLLAGRTTKVFATTVEHSAVIDTLGALPCPTEQFSVRHDGSLDIPAVLASIGDTLGANDTTDVLLCVQLCNNETGVAFDLDALLPQLHARFGQKPQMHQQKIKGGQHPLSAQRVWVLLDGAQALGKLDPARVRRALHFADYLSLSAHKLGGPAGVGALWVRPQAPFKAQMTGGTQERKRRAGTLNSVGALGFRLALEAWAEHGNAWRAHMRRLQEKLAAGLREIPGIVLHGVPTQNDVPALPNTLNFHVDGCPEESLLLALDLDGFCVSSGSACNSGSLKPSRVLTAMGFTRDEALSSLRVCVGVETTDQEVEDFLSSVRKKVAHIREARRQSAELLPEIRS